MALVRSEYIIVLLFVSSIMVRVRTRTTAPIHCTYMVWFGPRRPYLEDKLKKSMNNNQSRVPYRTGRQYQSTGTSTSTCTTSTCSQSANKTTGTYGTCTRTMHRGK